MMLKLKSPLLLKILFLSVIFYSCEKEYSLEEGAAGNTSVFTFTGASGPCANAVVTGSYEAGTALGSSNIITISVDVTIAGTYTISTDAVNGMSFSGSGSFTGTGVQIITLTGTGIPLVAGTFSFTPGTNGCSFPVVVVAGAVAADFFKCTIDGVERTFSVNLAGSTPDPTLFAIAGDETSASPSASFQLAVTKTPIVTTGDYDRISATNTSTYCAIEFSDGAALTPWGTGLLQGSGFTVKITSYTTNRIEGSFSGSLFSNSGAGSNEKVITNGLFSLSY